MGSTYLLAARTMPAGMIGFGKFFRNLALLLALVLTVTLTAPPAALGQQETILLAKLAEVSIGFVLVVQIVFWAMCRKEEVAIAVINREVGYFDYDQPAINRVKYTLEQLAADVGTLDQLNYREGGKKDAVKRRFKALHDAARSMGIVPEDERWNSYFERK